MSPIIVMRESYVLAAWFMLKYPNITIGAMASSAPLLYFDISHIMLIFLRDFKEAAKTYYKIIQKSWSVIDKVASQPNGQNGLSILSQRFNTYYPLE
ncbi:uncharacterized protein [Cicer arietinum]|uniref:uncharacterized protein isoform X3 n=1 Tax=Cicer arietinum TaxID=3827 RepID=UPI003CC6B2CC